MKIPKTQSEVSRVLQRRTSCEIEKLGLDLLGQFEERVRYNKKTAIGGQCEITTNPMNDAKKITVIVYNFGRNEYYTIRRNEASNLDFDKPVVRKLRVSSHVLGGSSIPIFETLSIMGKRAAR